MLSSRTTLATLCLAALVGGCGAPGGREPIGTTSAAITSICGTAPGATTFDGYPAFHLCGAWDVYSNDGKHTSKTAQAGWIKTEGGYGYQCVEFARRYFYFRWGVTPGWFIPGAKDMCTTHPADVSKTTNPVPGDLMVMGAGSCKADATYGHVGVINADHGTKWQLAQENPAGLYDWPKSCALCYLHAANNSGGGTADPCSSAPYGGYYCGESPQWPGGTPGTLYLCQNGVTSQKTVCQYGCNVAAPGTNDSCNPAPAGSGGASDAGADAANDTGTAGASGGGAAAGAAGSSWGGSGGTAGASAAGGEPSRGSTAGATGSCSVSEGRSSESGTGSMMLLALAASLLCFRRRRA